LAGRGAGPATARAGVSEHVKMSTPLLVLHDVDDPKISFREGQELAGRWSNATLMSPSQLGHTRILHDARAVTAAVNFVTESA